MQGQMLQPGFDSGGTGCEAGGRRRTGRQADLFQQVGGGDRATDGRAARIAGLLPGHGERAAEGVARADGIHHGPDRRGGHGDATASDEVPGFRACLALAQYEQPPATRSRPVE